jgi:glycosyltransferase involved in cell wall biosynthesis
MPGPTAAIVSFRLGGTDGVAIEAAKWEWALRERGFSVYSVAGAGRADHLIEGLSMDAREAPSYAELQGALSDADLVVVENLCSLPLNPAACASVAQVLRSRRAVLRHHDLPWQREATAEMPPPPDDLAWVHVTVNELSARELDERSISASVVRNSFDTSALPGDRVATRRSLGVSESELLVLQPTRAIPRKNVPGGVALAESLGATYWLLGPAEDGYGPELEKVLGGARVRVIHGIPGGESLAMPDVYAACDVVAMPSLWEGFGNPSVESAIFRKPLAIGPYPVAEELISFGFRWFELHESEGLAQYLARPDGTLVDWNWGVARRYFSLTDLPETLGRLFEWAGWADWAR